MVIPCTPALNIAPKSGGQSLNGENCMSGALQDIAERLTLSVTANTSTANQSIKGTTTSSSSSSTAASATLSNTGSTEPTFGGFGIKGVAIYQHSKSPPTITDEQTLNQAILNTSLTLRVDLRSCLDSPLRQAAGDAANAQDLNGFLSAAHSHFQALGAALATCLGNNGTDLAMRNYLASIVAYDAAAADVTQTPMLGFEYDLNTPASQPSYSSIKSNFSLGLGSTKAAQTNADCSGNAKTPANTLPCPAAKGALTPGAASPAPTNTAAKSAAKANTQPFTINVSLAVDLYNSEPSSSIPSASRLRDFQGGIELDYIVPSSKIKGIGSLIGDSTLAGSYYYQDQTSPSILTGPPSSITIANLPSTASSVYTARGPINLGQIRYGFGTGTNVSFPIAFTYSNRSELIAHPIKGLQFGISYNLSSLFASAAAKK